MKKALQITLILLYVASQATSQELPTVFTENDRIQDLIMINNETFYSSSTALTRLDAENNKVILDDRTFLKSCQDGKFFKEGDGWVYLGWEFVEYDLLLPILLIREYDGETLTPSAIDLYDKIYGGFLNSAAYISMDSIYILNGLWSDYQILRVDADTGIKETFELEQSYLEDLILMEDKTILIKGISALYTFSDNEIRDEITFDNDIIDFNYYPDNRIEVLTKNNIYWLDDKLNIETTIPLTEKSRKPSALYTVDDNIYLVETDDDHSYISSFDNTFNIISEFVEIPGIKYSDIRIFDNKFAMWGNNDCAVLSQVAKLDIEGVDYEIFTVDISIDDLEVKYESSTLDSFEIDDGVWKYLKFDTHSWEMTVTNNGDETIDFYEVRSSNYDEDGPYYINFEEETPLEAGESRTHTGEIKFTPFSAGQINFFTWIGTNEIDSNCSDNRIQGALITSTSDKETEKLLIYPNPAFNEIWVDFSGPISIKIFDMNGSYKMSQNNVQKQSIDISQLSSGMYYMEIVAAGISTINKFIKY